jgi:hypothetical protein
MYGWPDGKREVASGVSGDLWSTLIDGDTGRSKRGGTPYLGESSTDTMWRAAREAIQGFVGLVDVEVR